MVENAYMQFICGGFILFDLSWCESESGLLFGVARDVPEALQLVLGNALILFGGALGKKILIRILVLADLDEPLLGLVALGVHAPDGPPLLGHLVPHLAALLGLGDALELGVLLPLGGRPLLGQRLLARHHRQRLGQLDHDRVVDALLRQPEQLVYDQLGAVCAAVSDERVGTFFQLDRVHWPRIERQQMAQIDKDDRVGLRRSQRCAFEQISIFCIQQGHILFYYFVCHLNLKSIKQFYRKFFSTIFKTCESLFKQFS